MIQHATPVYVRTQGEKADEKDVGFETKRAEDYVTKVEQLRAGEKGFFC